MTISDEEPYPAAEDYTAQLLVQWRECERSEKFDLEFPGKLEEVASCAGWLFANINRVLYSPNVTTMPDPAYYSALVSWNAVNTVCAAIECYMRGFAMESIGLLRNVIETAAVILNIHVDPQVHELIRTGKHYGADSVKPAKKIIQVLGGVYGLLCGFAHVNLNSSMPAARGSNGKTHRLIAGAEFNPEHRKHLKLFVYLFPFVLSIFRNAVEFVFFDFVTDFQFWKKTDGGFQQSWAPEQKTLRDKRMAELGKAMQEFGVAPPTQEELDRDDDRK